MLVPVLEQYLAHQSTESQASRHLWRDRQGRVLGRYFKSTLTSAFQSLRVAGSDEVIGHEGFARSYSDADQGLCVWKLLDGAASDDESVELDRLCRMLHAINYFRQPAAETDLYLSVHARLLTAVEGNHGAAFSRILGQLALPQQRIVLQLPIVDERHDWLVGHVADNYRRNGFRIAVNASDSLSAAMLVDRVRPEAVKIDIRQAVHEGPILRLLDRCGRHGVRVIFKRVGNAEALDALIRIAALSGQTLYAQGFLWGLPAASLGSPGPRATGITGYLSSKNNVITTV